MKKHLSIIMLIIRSSLYPILGILAALAISECTLFYIYGVEAENLCQAIDSTPFFAMICAAVILVSIMLSRSMCNRGGRLNNTVLRLSLSENVIFGWQVLHNGLIYMLLFAMQGLLFVVFSFWYVNSNPNVSNHQTIFVTAYQHPLFHTFFPLNNLLGWICNGFVAMALGLCTAAYPFRQRHGKRSLTTFLAVMLFIFYLFIQQEDNHLSGTIQIMCMVGCVYCMIVSGAGVLSMEVDDYG